MRELLRKPSIREKEVMVACLSLLEWNGIVAWRNNVGRLPTADGKRWVQFGKVGLPDILGCLPGGKFLAVEVKRPGGAKRSRQIDFVNSVKSLGGMALFVESAEELEAALLAEGMNLRVRGERGASRK